MADPTHDAPRTTHPAEGRRRWIPSFMQIRLGILMLALTLGVTGMVRNDQRVVYVAMAFGAVGVILRFLKPMGTRR